MKILLLEDDEILNEIITFSLQQSRYTVESAFSGAEAEELLCKISFDLLLLDVNVPPPNGFNLLKSLREDNILTPAIFITSLNSFEDLKHGFSCGCDDYIKKPFELEELLLRIENVKRLHKIENSELMSISSDTKYSFASQQILKGNETFQLSKKESCIFEYFIKNNNRTVSLEELASNIWAYDEKPTDATIRTYVKNFRKILGEKCITTIKGVGYRFN